MQDKNIEDCCRNSVQTIQQLELNPRASLISSGPFQDAFQIDHRVLPYIFRFNYAALQKLRMSRAHHVPTLAHQVFFYLKDKLIVGRYSDGSRFANRMKFQQKIKFVIRAFDHGYSVSHRKMISNRSQNFNRQSQIEFFQRQQVKKYFLQQIQKALMRKKAQNERRIRYLERYIEMAIDLSRTDFEAARQIFEDKIKRKQLPWTDNMFMDISEFSRILYVKFTKPKPIEQKRILEMGLGEDGQWEMTEKIENSYEFDLESEQEDDFQKREESLTRVETVKMQSQGK